MRDGIDRPAERHAHALLARLGCDKRPTVIADHPALAWRRAGLMETTGRADGPGLVAPAALASAADGALAAFKALAPDAALPANGALLLGERARLLGLRRGGRVSANGSCRLLATRSGTVALNLPRPEDWELLPALFGGPAEDWSTVARLAAWQERDALIAQGRLLGLAIAADRPTKPAQPFMSERFEEARHGRDAPLVIDLSALWAGPLAASLLGMAGARVIKVESPRRPDGARAGHGRFYDLLNAGKGSVVVDFGAAEGVAQLCRLIDAADIVIEGSRHRALANLGIHAEEIAARGVTWVSITAHGRQGAAADWIGFGDDAAVAGGLASAMARAWDEPLFAGDAIADPLTGITAALAAWAGWRAGGGRLIALSLADVVANACALHRQDDIGAWQALADADDAPLYAMRNPIGVARPIGADTDAVLAEFTAR